MPEFNPTILLQLVERINQDHSDLSAKWLDLLEDDFLNLKRKRIDHIVHENELIIDPKFLKTVSHYHTYVNLETISIEYEYDYYEYDVRTRVKQKDSIVNKMIHYRRKESPTGKGIVPINKCLNDIFGIRIIFDHLNHEDETFQSFIESLCSQYKLRQVKKTEDEYIATHLYFKNEKNHYFPWELQVWSREDAVNNEQSHQKHKSKRKYTEWPSVYQKSNKPERRDL